jgi:hypothetical protein
VSATVLATDGGAATVAVTGISIDKWAPKVRIRGVHRGAHYGGQPPTARCAADDGLSGVASCTVTEHVHGDRVRVTARASDRAGNVSRVSLTYTSAR